MNHWNWRHLRCVALCVLCLTGLANADVTLTPGTPSAPPGALVALPLAITGASDAPTVIVLHLGFDPAILTPAGGGVLGPDPGASKTFDWNVTGSTLHVIAYSFSDSFTAENAIQLVFRVAAAAPTGDTTITLTNGSASNLTQADLAVQLNGVSINITPNTNFHASDYDHNWSMGLSELLRAIQFYNSGGFHCDATTEDGYAPGLAGDQSCAPHAGDYFPRDWKMNLSELLRLIQFYNLGGYHPDPNGEDGYTPGPF